MKRRLGPLGEVKFKPTKPIEVWSYDFIEDRTERGQRIRILGVVDEFTRECLALVPTKSFPADAVIDVLDWLMVIRGIPDHIRSDNGPEFIAKRVRQWLYDKGCDTIYITPGSPWENAFIESFFDKLRGEHLNRTLFSSIKETAESLEAWPNFYNQDRLHSSLGYLTPVEYAAQFSLNESLPLKSERH